MWKRVQALIEPEATLGRFTAISLMGTVLDFSVLWLLVSHAGAGVVPATVISTEVTIINAFIWNDLWTFRGRSGLGSVPQRFLSFNAMYAGTLVLSALIVGTLSGLFGPSHYLIYKAVTLPVNFVWNYLWSTQVIWRVRRTKSSPLAHPDDRSSTASVVRNDN